MILSLAGLSWESSSPSHYRLALPADTSASVDVSYLGDRWMLFLQHNGHVSTQCFDRRDDALDVVARAFNNGGPQA